MHIHLQTRRGAIALVALAALGCDRGAETRRRSDSTLAVAVQGQAVAQAGEALAARREAQPFLDSARSSLVARNGAAAANGLREAARFLRDHADSASGTALVALSSSADEIQRLAQQLREGKLTSLETLNAAFALAQLAEADFHRARAHAAWQGRDNASTAAELLMVVDHLDRAAADAGEKLAPAQQRTMAAARTVATSLARGSSVTAGAVDSTLSAMERQIQRLREASRPHG